MALRKLGYDPELLGFERVHNITKRIRRAGKSPEGIQPAPKSRMRISREQFGAAELEKMSRRESERRMQQEIVYLQQQIAFLKKLMRQPESADSDTSRMEKGNGNANKQKNTPYTAFEAEYGVFFR